jgi:hypothetical protein
MFLPHKHFCCQLGKKIGVGDQKCKKIKIEGQECLILK